MSKPTYPDIADPAVIVAEDGMFFVAWVQLLTDQPPRWVFVTRDRVRYAGPPYAGEDSLELIKALINDWWSCKKALVRPGFSARRLREWLMHGH